MLIFAEFNVCEISTVKCHFINKRIRNPKSGKWYWRTMGWKAFTASLSLSLIFLLSPSKIPIHIPSIGRHERRYHDYLFLFIICRLWTRSPGGLLIFFKDYHESYTFAFIPNILWSPLFMTERNQVPKHHQRPNPIQYNHKAKQIKYAHLFCHSLIQFQYIHFLILWGTFKDALKFTETWKKASFTLTAPKF